MSGRCYSGPPSTSLHLSSLLHSAVCACYTFLHTASLYDLSITIPQSKLQEGLGIRKLLFFAIVMFLPLPVLISVGNCLGFFEM